LRTLSLLWEVTAFPCACLTTEFWRTLGLPQQALRDLVAEGCFGRLCLLFVTRNWGRNLLQRSFRLLPCCLQTACPAMHCLQHSSAEDSLMEEPREPDLRAAPHCLLFSPSLAARGLCAPSCWPSLLLCWRDVAKKGYYMEGLTAFHGGGVSLCPPGRCTQAVPSFG